MNISAILCLLLLPFYATSDPAFQAHQLSKDEAIERAEAAIVRNGCSDLAPLNERPRLSADQPGADYRLFTRHELDCHAMRAGEWHVNGKPTWIIGFQVRYHCPECTDLRDRLVLMDKDGSNLRLENRKNRIKRILKDMRW